MKFGSVLRMIALVSGAALLASCADEPPKVSGTFTEYKRDGRVCIEVERNEARPRTLCGAWFPDGPIALEYGDCFTARWTAKHGGEFSDIEFAGHCVGDPQAGSV